MKRFIVIVLGAFVLTACSGSSGNVASGEKAAQVETPTAEAEKNKTSISEVEAALKSAGVEFSQTNSVEIHAMPVGLLGKMYALGSPGTQHNYLTIISCLKKENCTAAMKDYIDERETEWALSASGFFIVGVSKQNPSEVFSSVKEALKGL